MKAGLPGVYFEQGLTYLGNLIDLLRFGMVVQGIFSEFSLKLIILKGKLLLSGKFFGEFSGNCV